MLNNQKVCRKVVLKNEQDFHLFKRRATQPLHHTPKIQLGKTEGFYQQIYIENLIQKPLIPLKDLNSNQKAFVHARNVLQACLNLASIYGYFIINQNMVFFNSYHEIVVWINPDILQNHVKIYLPPTPQGEKAMIRSIIIFLKLWLRCDFTLLSESLHLPQLVERLKPLKVRPFEYLSIKTEGESERSRRNSVNLYDFKIKRKQSQSNKKFIQQTMIRNQNSNKQSKLNVNFMQISQRSMFLKNKHNDSMQVERAKQPQNFMPQKHKLKGDYYQHRTFANVYELPHSKTTINSSLGIKSYFPNKTTSKKNHIVQMIMQYDDNPDEFGKNNLVMEQKKEDRARLKKLKESLHGVIGQELNDLFESTILDDNPTRIVDSYIQKQFQNLLQ